ncbi:MAG: hypothetical protein ACREJ7_09970 [Candidatus Methylomirabilales bacterium]
MVLSGLCYLLLALAGVLGLGFGALLPAVQGYWPMGPWVGPAAAGLHFLGAARVAAAGPLPLRHLFPLTAAALLANRAFGAGLGGAAVAGALAVLAFRE